MSSRSKSIGTACVVCSEPVPILDGRSWRRKTCSRECNLTYRNSRYTPKPRQPLVSVDVRLWQRVKRMPSGCWEWQGYRRETGYGQIGVGRVVVPTHRIAWEFSNQAELPDGLIVRHTCDNPPCCNPAHLLAGTHADNSNDKVARQRQAKGLALPQTKLTDAEVENLRAYWAQGLLSQRELGFLFGISQGHVSEIVNGKYRVSA